MKLDDEALVLLVFIILVISSLGSGGLNTNNPLVWGPALIFQIPLTILYSLSNSIPILAPLLIIAFLAYFDGMTKLLGEPFIALVIFGAIIVLLGV